MFGQPIKIGLKTSNLPDETIDDIRTEKELEGIINSIQQGNVNNCIQQWRMTREVKGPVETGELK